VRKIKGNPEYNWHILGLKKREEGTNFVINSQFPITTDNVFYKKFDIRKGIYNKEIKRKDKKKALIGSRATTAQLPSSD
jgi:hypothetical protein